MKVGLPMAQWDGRQLRGVPETTLWTLHNRASEAARPDALLHDPWAVRAYEAIDYPYRETFGAPSQSHPLRALLFDRVIGDFLAEHPRGTVVGLGDGLQTTFWRVDNGSLRYLSIDLPEIVALREQVFDVPDRLRHLAVSAVDPAWLDEVDAADGVLVTAEGLLMYLEPDDARGLIGRCAERFPGGRMLFDSIPPWLSRKTLSGWQLTPAYTAPRMPFGLTVSGAHDFVRAVPGVAGAEDLRWPLGRGVYRILPALNRLPWFGEHRPANTLVRFAS